MEKEIIEVNGRVYSIYFEKDLDSNECPICQNYCKQNYQIMEIIDAEDQYHICINNMQGKKITNYFLNQIVPKMRKELCLSLKESNYEMCQEFNEWNRY